MNSTSKFVTSAAIKAEIKRHESLQSAVNRLAKQFERVADQQLRSGMKDYLHSIQGEPVDLRGPRGVSSLWQRPSCAQDVIESQTQTWGRGGSERVLC